MIGMEWLQKLVQDTAADFRQWTAREGHPPEYADRILAAIWAEKESQPRLLSLDDFPALDPLPGSEVPWTGLSGFDPHKPI